MKGAEFEDMIGLIIFLILGVISVGVIWCSSKIGSDGNWYEERKTEMESGVDSKD